MDLFENVKIATGSLPRNRHTQNYAKYTDPLKSFHSNARTQVKNP